MSDRYKTELQRLQEISHAIKHTEVRNDPALQQLQWSRIINQQLRLLGDIEELRQHIAVLQSEPPSVPSLHHFLNFELHDSGSGAPWTT